MFGIPFVRDHAFYYSYFNFPCLNDTTRLANRRPPSQLSFCCAEHSQLSQGLSLSEVYCFPASWNETLLQLYKVSGILCFNKVYFIKNKLIMLFMPLRELFL